MPRKVCVVGAGGWSGGGQAFLSNAAFARERHPVLQGSDVDVPLIPRNVPIQLGQSRPYLLAPQNAWPWHPVARGAREVWTIARLRAASEWFALRSEGVLRISSAIPSRRAWSPVSPVLHNVLDQGFDEALDQSPLAPVAEVDEAFVSIGSVHTYRNLPVLLEAFGRYRRSGGTSGLVLVGALGGSTVARQVEATARRTPHVTLVPGPVERAEALRLLADARAVILPSRVEASPLSVLEAVVLNQQVILSDIVGHRGIMQVNDARGGHGRAPRRQRPGALPPRGGGRHGRAVVVRGPAARRPGPGP